MPFAKPDTRLNNDPQDTQHGGTIIRWRSVREMQNALATSNLDKTEGRKMSSQRTADRSWYATKNGEEYADMLRNGWETGVKDVEGLDGLSTDRAEHLNFVRSVGGAFPIVPAYLAGVPDAMLLPTPEPTDALRGLTLVIDSGYYAGVNGDTVLTYAHSVMRLIAWLQAERVDCSVYVVCPIHLDGKKYIYTTAIRESGDVFQPERIAACVHPSWLRRAWFAMLEREYYDEKMSECQACQRSYGSVATVTMDEMKAALPEAYSVIMLPKVGTGDPLKAVQESITMKLRQKD